MPLSDRNSFANLMLFCRPYHDHIDRVRPGKLSVELLLEWKMKAESDDVRRGLNGFFHDPDELVLLDSITVAIKQEADSLSVGLAQLQESSVPLKSPQSNGHCASCAFSALRRR